VIAIVVAAASWTEWRIHQARRFVELARDTALHADSIEAARDTSRAVLFSGTVAALGDSVRFYQRRVIQRAQVADSLDRALGLERAARYRVEAQVTALRAEARAVVQASPDSTDVRTAKFGIRQEPFYIEAAVTLPRPPAEGTINARVVVDSAVFEARVGCGAAGPTGVRAATLSLAGPKWVEVRLAKLEQDARVCSPADRGAEDRRTSLLMRVASRISVTAGYGAVVTADGRMLFGPSVGVGWKVWP
jgi:hypothetical protein